MTQEELKKIRDAEIPENTSNGAILKQIQTKIGEITSHFSDPELISSDKIDMTKDIQDAGKTTEWYKSKFGSVMRSQEDVCKHFIEVVNDINKQPDVPAEPEQKGSSSSDDDLMLELQLLEYELELLDI